MPAALFDWFWDLAVMRTLQSWADAGRALPIDPVYAFAALAGVGLLVIWLLDRPQSIRDRKLPGETYLGKVTPKRLQSLLRAPPRKRLRSRRQMEAEIRKGAARNRRADTEGDDDGTG